MSISSFHDALSAFVLLIGAEIISFLSVILPTFYIHVSFGYIFGWSGILAASLSHGVSSLISFVIYSRISCLSLCKDLSIIKKYSAFLRRCRDDIESAPAKFLVSVKINPLCPGGIMTFLCGSMFRIRPVVFLFAVMTGSFPLICLEVILGVLMFSMSDNTRIEYGVGDDFNKISMIISGICFVTSICIAFFFIKKKPTRSTTTVSNDLNNSNPMSPVRKSSSSSHFTVDLCPEKPLFIDTNASL